jgi:ubiquinone/menaquinone biosynthesis C-methylase UbiE
MLPRVLEAEVMDSQEEAAEYDAMDHSEVNARFAADAIAARGAGRGGRWLDVGTGTARIPIEFAKVDGTIRITAVDLSSHMLELGARNIGRAGLSDRITLELVDAKGLPYADGAFDVVVSNSIIHHIPDPEDCLRELVRLVAPGGMLFVRDLFRPSTIEEIESLVEQYAGTDSKRGQGMLRDSLNAALRLEEVRAIVRSFGMEPSEISITSDRHWTWISHRPVGDHG